MYGMRNVEESYIVEQAIQSQKENQDLETSWRTRKYLWKEVNNLKKNKNQMYQFMKEKKKKKKKGGCEKKVKLRRGQLGDLVNSRNDRKVELNYPRRQ